MSDFIGCPLCHNEIPMGAFVCRGCGGSVEYGAPRWPKIAALLIGAVVWANRMQQSPTVAAVAGIAVGLGLYLLARKVFARRIVVKRRRLV